MEIQDMTEYKNKNVDKYSFAISMARHFFETYSESLDRISSYLSETGYTMNCESCRLDSQHITLYETDSIYVFGFTRENTAPAIMAETPDSMTKICKTLGLPHVRVRVQVCAVTETEKIHDSIRKEKNSEGAVVYLISREGLVVWAYKLKSEDYEFWRSVRETMRHEEENGVMETSTILGDKYGKEAQAFHAYCRLQLHEEDIDLIFKKLPTHLHEFQHLTDSEKQDLITDLHLEETKKKCQELIKPDIDVLILKGPPGSGKTTLGKTLASLLGGTYLDQDMTHQQSRKSYIHKIKVLLTEEKSYPLVLGKSHHTRKIRREVLQILPKTAKCVFVDFFHPEPEKWLNLARKRIMDRGLNHQSLVSTSACLDKVLSGFFQDMEPLDKSETKMIPVIPIDVTDTVNNWVFTILKFFEMSNDEKVSSAIEAALNEERKTSISAKKVPLYYAVTLNLEDKLSEVPIDEKIFRVRSEHVTLKYVGAKRHADDDLSYITLVGKKCLVKCVGYVQDSNCIAVVVELPADIPCSNPVPHITYGLAMGIRPFYSNDLIACSTIKKLSSAITVEGQIEAIY